jgi:hypothetical protein
MTTMRRIRPTPPPIYIEHSPFRSIEDCWTASSCCNDGHQLRAPQDRNTTRVVLPAACVGLCGAANADCTPTPDQWIRGPCWRLTYAAMIKATTMARTATSRA